MKTAVSMVGIKAIICGSGVLMNGAVIKNMTDKTRTQANAVLAVSGLAA